MFDREVPFELRLEDNNGPQEVASFESIRAKILVMVKCDIILLG